MNIKQEKGAFKNEPDLIFEKTEHADVFDEFKPNTRGPEETVEIKEEIIDFEELKIEQSSDFLSKIDHDSLPEKNVQFCPTIKKELENTSEVKDRDVEDIKKDNSEYIQSEFEVLTTHCDLPTLKNENTECSDGLTEEQVDGLKNNASAVLNKKRKGYTRRKNFNGHFLKRRVDYKFNGKLSKKNDPNKQFITRKNEKSFQCNICSKKCSRKFYLQIHLRSHTNEKPFKCNICSKEFTRKCVLKSHLITHTNEKPFQCNICCKKFSYKFNLRTHLKTHTKEKPFQCNICLKKFKVKSSIRTHLKIHTNEKPFHCNICSKQFAKKYNLQTHLRTHTKEKPFKCNVCSNEFTQKCHLGKHLKTHK